MNRIFKSVVNSNYYLQIANMHMLHDMHIHNKCFRINVTIFINNLLLLCVVYICAFYMMYFNFRTIYTDYTYFYSTVYRKCFLVGHEKWKYLVM